MIRNLRVWSPKYIHYTNTLYWKSIFYFDLFINLWSFDSYLSAYFLKYIIKLQNDFEYIVIFLNSSKPLDLKSSYSLFALLHFSLNLNIFSSSLICFFIISFSIFVPGPPPKLFIFENRS